MSIMIKGMEMPTEEEISKCIIVRHDGEVWIVEFDNLIDGGHFACYPTNPMSAVPVPPHGRLIDADALEAKGYCLSKLNIDYDAPRGSTVWRECVPFDEAPTIIPAEEEKRWMIIFPS